MKKLFLISLLVVSILLSIGIVSAATTVLHNPAAVFSGGIVDTAHAKIGTASWKNNGIKFETYLITDTTSQFGKTITIDDIKSIEYHTYKDTAQSGINFYINIYTTPYTGGSASWYGDRLTLEPMYSYGFIDTVGAWNKWSTDAGTNQLTIFDQPKSGFYGWSYPPTLADLQAGTINWNSYINLAPVTSIDYGPHTIKYLVVDTGSSTTVGFEGSVDSITLNLKDGSSYTFDLEGPCTNGDESESCCNEAGGDWQADLPAGYQCCGDDGNADFALIVWNGGNEDFLCNYDSTWYGGASVPGEIEYMSELKYDDLSNGAAWYYCDAKNNGADHGPNGIKLSNMDVLNIGFHEYLCIDYLNEFESIAECCGDDECNTGADDGVKIAGGTTITSSNGEVRCCTTDETWEQLIENCEDGYDNDCDGLADMADTDCNCVYTEWVNDECVSAGIMHQTRTETTGYDWCADPGPEGELEQTVADASCDCDSSEVNRNCVSNGYADVKYNWNFAYCGASPFTVNEADTNCNCAYVGETSRKCISDGKAQVKKEWNFDYCGPDEITQEADASCNCFGNWQKISCTGNSNYALFMRQRLLFEKFCSGNVIKTDVDSSCANIDSDKDGIININDQCPYTLKGIAVDNKGCSAEQFCSKYNAANAAGQMQCRAADWKDNEAFPFPDDCRVKTIGSGKNAMRWCGAAPKAN
jgi:hypothetical protein